MAAEKTGINWGSFASSAAGGAASGILSIFNQMYQRKTDRLNAQRQNEYNKQMAEYQYMKDLEMWNRANEYNLPENQMARLKTAGLNPNLIYGGAPQNAAVGNLPKYNAPEWVPDNVAPPNLAQALSAYQDFSMRQAQIDNLKAQRRVIESEGIIRAARAGYAPTSEYAKSNLLQETATTKQYERYLKEWEAKALSGVDKDGIITGSNLFNTSVQAKYQKNIQELTRSQAQVAKMNADRDIQEMNLKYMQWGSPAWSAFINGLRLIK